MDIMKTKNTIVEGTVEANAHRIKYWFDIGKWKACDTVKRVLAEAAEDRAKFMTSEGYISGELCTVIGDRDIEVRGWWEIAK